MASNRRRARKDTYLSKRGAKNKRFLLTALCLLIAASLGFAYLNSSMNKENEQMNKDIISNQKKLSDIKDEIETLKEDYEMRNTDEFKEKVAKEKLGMVKKGEDRKEENSVIKPIVNTGDANNQETSQENNQINQANEEGQVNSQNQGQNQESPNENGENTTDNADGR